MNPLKVIITQPIKPIKLIGPTKPIQPIKQFHVLRLTPYDL